MAAARTPWLIAFAVACGGTAPASDGGVSGDAAGEACPPDVPATCYAGSPETEGIGICHAGVPRCEDGVVVECLGAVLPEAEWCDARDDDCDGEIDEAVCRRACIGLDCERPWGEPPTDFIIGPHGGIALELADDDPIAVLWVPEQNSGTLAKVDTRQRRVLARYQVVPPGDGCPDNGEVLTNVAVDPAGNVYVSTSLAPNPEQPLEARILSVAYGNCADRDGDGVVETSAGPDDVRPFLEDECVRWHVPFVPHAIRNATGLAFERRARRTGPGWLLWASSPGFGRIWALDPDSGQDSGDELWLEDPAQTYFLDFDGPGVLAGRGRTPAGDHGLLLIDTQRSRAEIISLPFAESPAGMIQDHRGRLWMQPGLTAYDSAADEWVVPSFHGHETGKYFLGIDGFVTAPNGLIFGESVFDVDGNFAGEEHLVTYDIETDEVEVHLDVPLEMSSFALDRDGQVWQLEIGPPGVDGVADCLAAGQPSSAWVWDPWTRVRELAIDGELWGSIFFADNPTGVVPLDILAGPRSAVWSFRGCDPATEGGTLWGALDFRATDVESTHIRFEVQGGDGPTWSAEGPWLAAGQHPEQPGPIALPELVQEPTEYLHVRATLWGDQLSPPFRSPELLRIEAAYACPDDVD